MEGWEGCITDVAVAPQEQESVPRSLGGVIVQIPGVSVGVLQLGPYYKV